MKILVASALLLSGLASGTQAQTALTYQKPPAAIEELLDAPLTPLVKPSPDSSLLLVEQLQSFPSIAEVAQPRYRLAGIRFNPATNGPSREVTMVKLWLQPVAGGAQQPIAGLPAMLKATHLAWSPDSKHVAFVQKEAAGLHLWTVDVAKLSAHRVGSVKLNAVLGNPCEWLSDSRALLCKVVPAARGAAPVASEVPAGPDVSENLGKVTPARTYRGLLKPRRTRRSFVLRDFRISPSCRSMGLLGRCRQRFDRGSATVSPTGALRWLKPCIGPSAMPCPGNFPAKVSVVMLRPERSRTCRIRPLLDAIPIAFDAVQAGPRDYAWRSDAPATLVWIEARDGGDPKAAAPVRDRLMKLAAPFDRTGEEVIETRRCGYAASVGQR